MECLKWKQLDISLERNADASHLVWRYLPLDHHCWGGYVSIHENDGFITLETDDAEGSAHFPSALLPAIIERLQALVKDLSKMGTPAEI